MVTLNDYLYSGNTVLKILHQYIEDLMESARVNHNTIDVAHCNILIQIKEILEHNDFLTSQSQRIKELYKQMLHEYPFLAFTFKGRIKSLIRAEEKINGYIVEYISDYYIANGKFPTELEIKNRLMCFRDIIAYRIVISLPKCQVKEGESQEELEIKYLYQIANMIPAFLEERGFTAELSGITSGQYSPQMDESVRPYFRDYIVNTKPHGYQSLHITLYDNFSRCFTEVQLRTKEMDDNAEIGEANHFGYEKQQELDRVRNQNIPVGECKYFDEACERIQMLRNIRLAEVDVNMFKAIDNYRINDGCGLFRGRQILPFEHLSRFQND
ncbi:MAG: guanosine polyphosphate pyrophosphohydrolase [Eubacteriales bacterium]|nr:guanosine polyphosphate pyrophosphohydrolase [Eubacteriales bacterium]